MAGGGGAWKVAYADFVTAMMAFFMVMWLVGQKQDVKEAIAKHFKDPFDEMTMEEMEEAGATGGGNRQSHSGKMNGAGKGKKTSPSERPEDPESSKPRILMIRPNDATGAGTVVFFEGMETDLPQAGREMLDRFIPTIAGMPNKIEIRGHALRSPNPDNDPWQLSYTRCLAVMKYMESKGITPQQMRLSQAGGNEPLSIKPDSKTATNNPRVEIMLLAEWVQDSIGTKDERENRFQSDKPEAAASIPKPLPAKKAHDTSVVKPEVH